MRTFALLRATLAAATLAAAGVAFAHNFKAPYTHYSNNEPIPAVLADFAHAQGMSYQVLGQVGGVLSGRFTDTDPNQFLEGMRSAFGVRHYVLGSTVTFYPESDYTQELMRPANMSPAQLARELRASGMVSGDLPVKEQGQVISVSGPHPYVEQLLSLARNLDASHQSVTVMRVFKLRHAKADDTTIETMNKKVVIPGVASILSRMVTGVQSGSTGTSFSLTSSTAQTSQKLRGTGLAAQSGGGAMQQSSPVSGAAPAAQSSASGQPQVGIMADSRTNSVLINDIEKRMPYYERVIADLDVPLRLVELHAAIVDIDISAEKDLGISWQGRHNRDHLSIGAGVGSSSDLQPGLATASTIANSSSGGIFSTVFSDSHTLFLANVKFLEENSRARTLGRPSVLTVDNVSASLEDTTTRYIKVSGNQDVDLFKVEAGTVLEVTPHIIEDQQGGPRLISMTINIQSNQDTSDSFSSSTTTSDVPPIKQTRIHTQALVREGQSLLLGGYYVESGGESDSGLPGLKDIPVAGKLFGSEGETSSRRERLVLITPRILDLGELQEIPSDLDDQAFMMSPTQDNYLKRAPKRKDSSGCSSNRSQGSGSNP